MPHLNFDGKTNYCVISDLHGQGKLYDLLINNFDKEGIKKKITLIINGDIIDRGPESIRMIVDIMERSKKKKGNFDIVMLPGNHEQMMYSALKYLYENGSWKNNDIWFLPDNHGYDTAVEFGKLSSEKQKELYEFLGSLPLYCTIKSKENDGTSYAIVHAAPPSNAMISSDIPTLKEIVSKPEYKNLIQCLTYRENDDNSMGEISLPNKDVVTVIGHTPVETDTGFMLKENGKLLMIDGGCSYMAQNPNSKIFPEMATLVNLSEDRSKVRIVPYGSDGQKDLRMAAKSR